MTPSPDPADDRRTAELQNLLAVYLATAPWPHCPGCDAMLVDEALHDYTTVADAGGVPGEADLIVRHPQLAAQIVAFFFLMCAASNSGPRTEFDHPIRRTEHDRTPPSLT